MLLITSQVAHPSGVSQYDFSSIDIEHSGEKQKKLILELLEGAQLGRQLNGVIPSDSLYPTWKLDVFN